MQQPAAPHAPPHAASATRRRRAAAGQHAGRWGRVPGNQVRAAHQRHQQRQQDPAAAQHQVRRRGRAGSAQAQPLQAQSAAHTSARPPDPVVCSKGPKLSLMLLLRQPSTQLLTLPICDTPWRPQERQPRAADLLPARPLWLLGQPSLTGRIRRGQRWRVAAQLAACDAVLWRGVPECCGALPLRRGERRHHSAAQRSTERACFLALWDGSLPQIAWGCAEGRLPFCPAV